MFTTKFWFTLVTLALGAAVAILLVARTSYNAAREEDTRNVLRKDRDQAWALLKSEARVRIDEALRVAVNPTVVSVLGKASTKADSLTSDDRASLSAALRQENKNLEGLEGDLLVALDRRGEAVAAEWPEGPLKIGSGISGMPSVQDALRGYMTDDVWALSLDGANPAHYEVFRIAARPVIGGGQYIGAIVHGQALDREFANTLAQRLQAQVVFFRGTVIEASGQPATEGFVPFGDEVVAIPIQGLLSDEEFLRTGRSDVVELPGGGLAVYALVTGQAAYVEGANVGYAVVRPLAVMGSPVEFLTAASTLEDWREVATSVPGIAVMSGFGLILILGFVFFSLEQGAPLRKFRKALDRLASREVDRLNVYGVSRKHRRLADAINRAMDKAVQDVAEKLGKKPADIDQILGPRDTGERVSSALFTFPDGGGEEIPPPPPAQTRPAAPPGGPAGPPPPQAPAALQAPSRIAPSPATPSPGPGTPAAVQPVAVAPVVAVATPPSAPLAGLVVPAPGSPAPAAGPALAPQPAAPQVALADEVTPPPAMPVLPRPGSPSGRPPSAAEPGPVPLPRPQQGPADLRPVTPARGLAVAPTPPPGSPAGGRATPPRQPQLQVPPGFGPVQGGEEDEDKTEIAGVPEELLRAAQRDELPEVDEETYFHQVFDEFVAAKKRCSERTDNLQYDRFRQTLQRNKDALVERYGCKSVRFQVYVKDGKAALKATPVRG